VASLVLAGGLGFHYFESGRNPEVVTLGDSLWWVIVTLTTVGYGDISPVTSGGRLVALVLMVAGIGTLSMSTAAIAAYLVRLDQLAALRAWTARDHVIVCGLGTAGLLLAQAFVRAGHRVVVIERDADNPRIQECRDSGAVVIIGNAAGPAAQRRARIERARYLVIVCGSDGDNVEVAAHARTMAIGRRHALVCSTQIIDPDLWYLLRSWELATSDHFRLEFFNLADLGSRALLEEHSPFRGSPADTGTAGGADVGRPPHVLVVGADRFAQDLIIHAARQWADRSAAEAGPLPVTLIDDRAPDRAGVAASDPFDGVRAVSVVTHAMDVRSTEFHRAAFLFDAAGGCSVTHAYVCLEDEARGLSAALVLLNRLRRFDVPVVVRMHRATGLASLLDTVRDQPGFERLRAFGLLEHAWRPDLVLRGTNEVLAQAIHEEYLASQLGSASGSGRPSLVPWDRLPSELKEANRSLADHIGTKLEAVGCHIGPPSEPDEVPIEFTPEEVERMAVLEHERWLGERQARGWTPGVRDPAAKTHPSLVPWERLDEESREMNRRLVARLPELMGRAGLAVYRHRS
jgi:voltage-gated potassium channel Kch